MIRLEIRHHKPLLRAAAHVRHALQHHLLPLGAGVVHRGGHKQRKAELPPHLLGVFHLMTQVAAQEIRDL